MKNKNIAGIIAVLIGGLGFHKFYLGRKGAGIGYLLFSWTFIPTILSWIDALVLFTMSDESFNLKYNSKYIIYQDEEKTVYSDDPVDRDYFALRPIDKLEMLADLNKKGILSDDAFWMEKNRLITQR